MDTHVPPRSVEGSGSPPCARAPAYDDRVTAAVTRPTAAFFDLDKTIIAKSSTLAFSKPFQAGGLISRRAMLRSAYAQFVYLVGGADHDQMEKLRAFMSQLCAGWDVATVREIVADTLHNVVDPLVYDEAVSLIEEHRLAGRDIVIVSTSGAEVVGPIGEMLGADRVVATKMEIVDGRYTGEIEHYVYAEEKATAILDLAEHGRLRPAVLLRLQRLGDRRPDARGGRPRPRREPRQGAAEGRGVARLAGAGVHQAGGVAQPGSAPASQADAGRAGRRRGDRGGRIDVERPPQACRVLRHLPALKSSLEVSPRQA